MMHYDLTRIPPPAWVSLCFGRLALRTGALRQELFQHGRPATTTTKSSLPLQGNKTETASTGSKVLQQQGLRGAAHWNVLFYYFVILPSATAHGHFGVYHRTV